MRILEQLSASCIAGLLVIGLVIALVAIAHLPVEFLLFACAILVAQTCIIVAQTMMIESSREHYEHDLEELTRRIDVCERRLDIVVHAPLTPPRQFQRLAFRMPPPPPQTDAIERIVTQPQEKRIPMMRTDFYRTPTRPLT
jgi:hypothetical protein